LQRLAERWRLLQSLKENAEPISSPNSPSVSSGSIDEGSAHEDQHQDGSQVQLMDWEETAVSGLHKERQQLIHHGEDYE